MDEWRCVCLAACLARVSQRVASSSPSIEIIIFFFYLKKKMKGGEMVAPIAHLFNLLLCAMCTRYPPVEFVSDCPLTNQSESTALLHSLNWI